MLPSLFYPQAFYLTAVSLDLCNTFADRLGQACKKNLYHSKHRNNSENALVNGYFQHVAGHLASASCWAASTHMLKFRNLFTDLKFWTREPQRELNSQCTRGRVGVHFNLQKLAVAMPLQMSPTSRQMCACVNQLLWLLPVHRHIGMVPRVCPVCKDLNRLEDC